jgi:NADH:flavin oxidoreductase / NADH oxidase family
MSIQSGDSATFWERDSERTISQEPTMTLKQLFSPLQVGALTLPNRIVMAPLTRGRAGAERIPNDRVGIKRQAFTPMLKSRVGRRLQMPFIAKVDALCCNFGTRGGHPILTFNQEVYCLCRLRRSPLMSIAILPRAKNLTLYLAH